MLALNCLPIMYLQLVLIILHLSVTIDCGIQPTGFVTMAMEVLHNTCNVICMALALP